MIGRLHGQLIAKQPPWLLLDVGGVGYEIESPMSSFFKLPSIGEAITLHTHLVVRDDAHLLYGFVSLDERALFRELIKVSGIGPRVALALLSGVSADELWSAVRDGDAAVLTRVPGVGKKTAERLMVEMRDRGEKMDKAPVSLSAGGGSDPLTEARAALTALGYKPTEVHRHTEAAYQEGMNTEDIIRDALKRSLRR